MKGGIPWLLLRFVCAVVVAALICGAGVAIAMTFVFGPEPGGAVFGLFSTFALATLVSGPFIVIGTVVIGIPADWLLRRLEFRHPLGYAAAGVAGAMLPAIPLALATGETIVQLPLIFAAYGLVAATSYWFFVPRLSKREG